MPHSFDNVLLHVVFATKFREKILGDDIRSELHAYIGGIAANIGSVLHAAGSVSDHIHLLVSLPRTCTTAKPCKTSKPAPRNGYDRREGDTLVFRGKWGTPSSLCQHLIRRGLCDTSRTKLHITQGRVSNQNTGSSS